VLLKLVFLNIFKRILSLSYSFFFKYKNTNVKRRFKRRLKKRRRGKHLYSLFLSRKKKYLLYYQPFDSRLIYKNFGSSKNFKKISQSKKKLRIGLKSKSLKLIRVACLKSLKFVSQRNLRSLYIDKFFKYNISILPDYWLTSKPKSVRMGKGKGEKKFKVFFLNRGLDVYNFKYIKKYSKFLLNYRAVKYQFSIFVSFLLKVLKGKLSLKSNIYKKIY